MFKKTVVTLLLTLSFQFLKAQTAETVYNADVNFNLAKLQGQYDQALSLGEKLLPNAEKPPGKVRVMFYYSIGNLLKTITNPTRH